MFSPCKYIQVVAFLGITVPILPQPLTMFAERKATASGDAISRYLGKQKGSFFKENRFLWGASLTEIRNLVTLRFFQSYWSENRSRWLGNIFAKFEISRNRTMDTVQIKNDFQDIYSRRITRLVKNLTGPLVNFVKQH